MFILNNYTIEEGYCNIVGKKIATIHQFFDIGLTEIFIQLVLRGTLMTVLIAPPILVMTSSNMTFAPLLVVT